MASLMVDMQGSSPDEPYTADEQERAILAEVMQMSLGPP